MRGSNQFVSAMVHLFTKFHKYIQYKIQQFFIETEANKTKKKKSYDQVFISFALKGNVQFKRFLVLCV